MRLHYHCKICAKVYRPYEEPDWVSKLSNRIYPLYGYGLIVLSERSEYCQDCFEDDVRGRVKAALESAEKIIQSQRENAKRPDFESKKVKKQ